MQDTELQAPPQSHHPRLYRRGPQPRHRVMDKTLPNQIKRMRLERNLSQQELADAVGLQRTHVCSAEKTGRGLSRQNWYKLADFFGVSAQYLETPYTSQN